MAVLALALATAARAQPAPHKIIFDTDFGMVPQDDAFALILALHSPELEILGVTTVAGNFSVEQATADALRLLEIAGRRDIPVYRGANMPLLHEKSEYATTHHGEWWSDAPPTMPPGGFAARKEEAKGAAQFIVDTVGAQPGQVTLMAIGPLIMGIGLLWLVRFPSNSPPWLLNPSKPETILPSAGYLVDVLPALIRKFTEAVDSGGAEVEIWGTGSPRRSIKSGFRENGSTF